MGIGNFAGIGTWKLVAYTSEVDGGNITYPLGKDAVGQLMYDANGYMAAQIADVNRPKFATEDYRKLTPEETGAAFKGYVAYYGTYEVDEGEKAVIHHVVNSLLPNWAGTDLIRLYEFTNNRMTLRSERMVRGSHTIVLTLVWDRVA
jgi:hypothetical protein